MEFAQGLTLILAAFAMGHMAGFFYTWSQNVMPALRSSDDRMFIAGFQALDRAVMNPWFMAGFVGAPLLTGVAALLLLGQDDRSAFWWAAAAFVLYVVVVGITRSVHLPLNAELQAAGDPDRIADPAALRERFESRWVRWNMVRTVAVVGSFGCLLLALVQFGRAT
jgi:uncharacterized membrane protein